MSSQTKSLRRRIRFIRTTPRTAASPAPGACGRANGSSQAKAKAKAKAKTETETETGTIAATAALATETPAVPEPDRADDNEAARTGHPQGAMIPDLFAGLPPVADDLRTSTSTTQEQTAQMCMLYLSAASNADLDHNGHGVPRLDRDRHVRFLHKTVGRLPAPFVAADASRPWFLYWSLNALALLGEDVSGAYADRVAATARSMQNPGGGFGGGHDQTSHLATTYATVLALALVGIPDALAVIDRRAMWKWLCSLKQADGGFRMSVGGEEDVRGAYCAAVVITLLNLPLDLSQDSEAYARDPGANLFTNLGDYVRRCQTFEGGISGQPDAEAHGAYAFCALGCLSLLGSPDEMISKYLNVPRLISWLSSRQYAPEGGFSGRTNKLVDGCYSHWVGGCWPLIEACLKGPIDASTAASATPESMFSREGLIRYILCCCQDLKRGGLRDKPGKSPDAYHSCYVLAGLSSAENRWQLISPDPTSAVGGGGGGGGGDGDGDVALEAAAPRWVVSPYQDEVQVFDEGDRVAPVHPLYVIPEDKVASAQAYFAALVGF
ncbi:farnesyltransferase subunit beta [Gaeumannomyces tritici R3-111a-1]|uniref:Protein farnesyltransferase subunit beta n=1 Tax=Gaeumannomyces tritici (strain R3-111a-1) TaxID=644352 RepID=J3NFK9_GAET3|nr:farnesyltransferase subunit beta [Gaeumannomyces tritici R3-111a-1]EJT80049.1 farnesyltransferase subunit beta [Gaeumannomyces tritici R3-111a-1]